jgi:Flp pilus assembly pilin Flp
MGLPSRRHEDGRRQSTAKQAIFASGPLMRGTESLHSTATTTRGGAMKIRRRLSLRRDEGATSVEYSIMAAAVAAVIIVAVLFLGQATNNNFICTRDSITAHSTQC